MRLRDHPHAARQYRTQLLQSVAFTVGVGKTFLANALGHIAVRRHHSVHTERADKLFKRLRGARLDPQLRRRDAQTAPRRAADHR